MTADNEKEHAKLFYEYLGDIRGHVDAEYPFELGTTEENLESAAAGEKKSGLFFTLTAKKQHVKKDLMM